MDCYNHKSFHRAWNNNRCSHQSIPRHRHHSQVATCQFFRAAAIKAKPTAGVVASPGRTENTRCFVMVMKISYIYGWQLFSSMKSEWCMTGSLIIELTDVLVMIGSLPLWSQPWHGALSLVEVSLSLYEHGFMLCCYDEKNQYVLLTSGASLRLFE